MLTLTKNQKRLIMQFINDTPYPALHFEGIDQLSQTFHTVVMRVSCTWNDKGLLSPCHKQDGLCMEDVLVDSKDFMSGVLEESDLCHYKPKCDILILGSAYTPKTKKNIKSFECRLTVQTPDKWIFEQPIMASKYLFANNSTMPITTPKRQTFVKGTQLIDKTLSILAPSIALLNEKALDGSLRYSITTQNLPNKTPLTPNSSFGGYCYIEETDETLPSIPISKQLPKDARDFKINDNHGTLAYFIQDNYNPYGTGYLDPVYALAKMPKNIKMPVIHYPSQTLSTEHLTQMSLGKLKDSIHDSLVAGFGIRSKSHPQRHQYLGEIDENYLQNKTPTPKGFDFAIWNCAYPDQQVEKLAGNEWITLTNLSSTDTKACHIDENGNTILNLYLPELLAYLVTTSHEENLDASEVPMKLDTVIIRPDEQKVHLVWRGIIAGAYNPKVILLQTADRQTIQATLDTHFTQKGAIIRPYEEEHK